VTSTGFSVVGPAANGATKVTAQVADTDVVFRVIDAAGLDLTGGEVNVTGAASTNGFQEAPQTLTIAGGDTLSVEAQLLGSALPNVVANDLVIVEGDSIILGAGAPQTINDPLRTGAVVVALYDVMDVEVVTIDKTGALLGGSLDISGGATVTGSSPQAFQTSGGGAILDITATYLNETFVVAGVQVDLGDSIAVKRSSAGITIEEHPGHYAGLSKVAMVMQGDISITYETVDKDDSYLANGRVVINGGGTHPTPYTQDFVGNGSTVDVVSQDITVRVPMVAPTLAVFDGDSIVVDASATFVDTIRYPGVVAAGARITVILRSVWIDLETIDFAGNFLPNGRIQIAGPTVDTQTNGFKETPYTVKRADGDTISVESLLAGSALNALVVVGLNISEGDSVVLSDEGPQKYPGAVSSGARITLVYNVMSVTVATVDPAGDAINGHVDVPGAGGASGPSPQVLQLSASGVTIAEMTGFYESESYTPTSIVVALGDSIVIRQGLGGLEVDTHQVGLFGAKINLEMIGDVAVSVEAIDGKGDPLATGQVQVDQGGLTPSPLNLTRANGTAVEVNGLDTATLGTVSQSGMKIFDGDSLVVSATGVERFSNHFSSGAKVIVVLESVDVQLRSVDAAFVPIPAGELSVLGTAFSSNGFQSGFINATIANGDTLNIVSHVLGNPVPDVTYPTIQVSKGDSIVLGGPQGNEYFNDPQREDAVIMVIFPLVDLEVSTTDEAGLPISGIVSIVGGTTGPSPKNLSISSDGTTVTVTGSYETENYTAPDIPGITWGLDSRQTVPGRFAGRHVPGGIAGCQDQFGDEG
jgi:hypothetical protein